MKILLSHAELEQVATDLLVLGVRNQKPSEDPLVARLDAALKGTLRRAIATESFKADANSQLVVHGSSGLKAKRVALLGLGKDPLTAPRVRDLAVRASRLALDQRSVAVVLPDNDTAMVEVLADGLVSGGYRYDRYLTGSRKPKKSLNKGTILVNARVTNAMRVASERGVITAEAANLARDLVNSPPNDLTATVLAETCQSVSRTHGITCKVWDKKGIERLGMPLLLAVNRGSAEEPRFIHMTYKPKGGVSTKKVALVGKGLTFDAGGLCIKPAASMLDMKSDMSGAAVTLATVVAAARLALPVEVHAIIGSTDNMTGGNAYRPGDVFPSRKGLSVEIINTDAEGRLVLADALAYAQELSPDYIIDHATLTGASMVALGPYRAALFANDDTLRESYRSAGETTGEPYWPMPLDDDLRDQLKSSIADLKHTGSRLGGTITAALFLREFVGNAKWAHLDIAGPSFLESTHGIYPRGGTGFGVLTALQFLRDL